MSILDKAEWHDVPLFDRNKLAADALLQLLANRSPSLWTEGAAIRKMEAAALADFAYALADAMEERSQQPTAPPTP